MKHAKAISLMTAGIALSSALSLHAQIVTYDFSDLILEQGDVASVFVGDIANGQVSIDHSNGDYTVTWNSSTQAYFLPPLEFILNLGNSGTGDVVSLSEKYDGFEAKDTISYSGNDPVLMNWFPGDYIVTKGTVGEYGVDFTSGIYTLFPGLPVELGSDELDFGGSLEGEITGNSPTLDSDNDGLTDDVDPFPNSDMRSTVVFLGVDTKIPNQIQGLPVNQTGTTLTDVIVALEQVAATEAKNHGIYIQRLTKEFKILVKDGWLTSRQRSKLLNIAAGSLK